MYESAMHRWNCIRKHLVQQYWHYFINFHVYGLMTLVCLPGLVWLARTALSRTYFIHELVRKFVLATWKNLVEIQGRKVRWYSFILARTQNHLVFHLNWPELTVHALFIIYRTSSIGMYLREIRQLCLDLLHFKAIMIQINVLSQQSCECKLM